MLVKFPPPNRAAHRVTLLPDKVRLLVLVASNQNDNPEISVGVHGPKEEKLSDSTLLIGFVFMFRVPATLSVDPLNVKFELPNNPVPPVATVNTLLHPVDPVMDTEFVAAGPMGPVTPVGPVGPVTPVGPVVPVLPVNPVGPVLPVSPVNPVGPVVPVGPVGPVLPVNPVGPVHPVGPVCPVGPTDPTDTSVV